MAINMRRGNDADFDPTKLTAGELAVLNTSKSVAIAFADGSVGYIKPDIDGGSQNRNYYGKASIDSEIINIDINGYVGYEEGTRITLYALSDIVLQSGKYYSLTINGESVNRLFVSGEANISQGQVADFMVLPYYSSLCLKYLWKND